ncbi:structural cement protein Gp24 [Commensalibacter papalotli (ex Servin-Garciduenas et al. 2014)]|uniref:Uncharacterized protein n=1 Tax=Commensalibacter papalotli (ex Servin-Garciduenas et al. 2014) TaxID=1208583 RepID=W7DZ19_9PROT|nr:hypothetical protein [Commensalibacter papalotli (ex Servin-Garciduenas et al. 2014)]EUK19263.1 hypothetical protein COMX_05915 [Commensalibacter papalotli (ex Servin-Garciduenas et al. 2014)]
MSFQQKVNLGLAKGWHGDFASSNVRVSFLGDPQAEEVLVMNGDLPAYFMQKGAYYQAGTDGVKAGSFVWVDEETHTIVNKGEGSPAGFVGRELTGVPAQYLEQASMNIPAGFMVTVYDKGEFLVALPKESSAVQRGEVVNVDVTTGNVSVGSGTETKYKYVASAKGGDLVAISAWI